MNDTGENQLIQMCIMKWEQYLINPPTVFIFVQFSFKSVTSYISLSILQNLSCLLMAD